MSGINQDLVDRVVGYLTGPRLHDTMIDFKDILNKNERGYVRWWYHSTPHEHVGFTYGDRDIATRTYENPTVWTFSPRLSARPNQNTVGRQVLYANAILKAIGAPFEYLKEGYWSTIRVNGIGDVKIANSHVSLQGEPGKWERLTYTTAPIEMNVQIEPTRNIPEMAIRYD